MSNIRFSEPPCHLPPTHPNHPNNRRLTSASTPAQEVSARKLPTKEEEIVLRLPRSAGWARTIMHLASFLCAMDCARAELKLEGDELYVQDVMHLVRKLRVNFQDDGIPEAEILLASMPTEEALSVLHSAMCDEDHRPEGNCGWRRRLRRGHFALL